MVEIDELSVASSTKTNNFQLRKRALGSNSQSKQSDDNQSVSTCKTSIKSSIKNKKYNSISNYKNAKKNTTKTKRDENAIRLEQEALREEELKSLVTHLQSHAHALEVELLSYVNKNQLMRKDILIAKSVLKREVDENIGSFEDLQKIEEEGWLGREEIVLSLKKKLYKLRNEFQQRGGLSVLNSKRFSNAAGDSSDLNEDRLELERENIVRNQRRELKIWLKERDTIREKLKPLLIRNSVLAQQASTIRCHLSEAPSLTSITTISEIQELERKMKAYLESKSKLTKSLEAEEVRSKELDDDIEKLKNEVLLQRAALKKSENNLKALKSKDKELQRLTNDVRIERLSNSRMFQKDLFKVIESYQRIWELFDFLPREVAVPEGNSVEFVERRNLKAICAVEDCEASESVHNIHPNILSHSGPVGDGAEVVSLEVMSGSGDTGNENKTFENLEAFINSKVAYKQDVEELENEFIALSLILQETEKKIIEKAKHVQSAFICLKMEFCQFLNQNHIFWKESLSIKMLRNKLQRLKRLQKPPKCKPAEDNFSYNEHPDVEDNKLVLQILRNEQSLLESLVKTVFTTVGEDFDKYLYLCKNRDLSLRICH